MSIFDDIIGKNADDRLAEEMLYAEAMSEIEQGLRRDGLWGKALADGEGNQEKAKGLYLKYRVQALKDELQIEREKIKQTTEEEKKVETSKQNDKNNPVSRPFLSAVLWVLFLLLILLITSLIGEFAWK